MTGTPPVDMRGRAPSANKTAEDTHRLVVDHVKSLPTCSSHYSRAKSQERVYLPPGYTREKCHKLYLAKCDEDGVPADKRVIQSKYESVMRTYNIGVNPPKTTRRMTS